MKILITICARKGSKRLPSKNIKELAGKPLIAHSIDQALKWGKAQNVVVSTDSKEIAEIASKYGAEVPFIRPEELSDDRAGKVPVIRHAMLACEKIFKIKYDIVIDFDVTNPLRRRKDIDDALDAFMKIRPKILLTVTKANTNPYFNMLELNKNGFAQICKSHGNNRLLRHQDAPEVYTINTCIYIYDAVFLNDESANSVFTDRTAIHIMPDISRYDIDCELDFKWIEFIFKTGLYSFD